MAGHALGRPDHHGRLCRERVLKRDIHRILRRLGRRRLVLIGQRGPARTWALGARASASARVGGTLRTERRGVSQAPRRIGLWAFSGVAITSLGGPLALGGLIAPGVVASASRSAALAMLAAAVVFVAPLAIWLRYSRMVQGPGGLFGFVEAAAGRPVALAQAGIWIFSYLLYLVYTTIQIVYDLLPAVVPGERAYQSLLAILIPVGLAGVMIAGRGAALLVAGMIALGQLALAGVLDGVTVAHLGAPSSSLASGAPPGAFAKASAQTSLLYICGSLPLFLGGELAAPVRTIRRGLIGAYVLTVAVVFLAVAPLAAAPGLLRTQIPGVSLAQQYSSPGVAKAIGIGIAVSTAGVMLCEYLALTRLAHAIGGWRLRPVSLAIGALIVLIAPVTLIDPQGFYSTLSQPSLVALWISQLIVFLAYPRFALKHRQPMAPAWVLSLAASGLAMYGIWTALQTSGS